jgi:two-component system, OmpR family, phosphate regulon sensor histidine kinase PhoR
MTLKFKKSYKFAIKSSFYIALFSFGLLAIVNYFLLQLPLYCIVLFVFSLSVFSFFILQYRVENFIYKGVKKIYDDVSLLDNTDFRNQPITTDMDTLTSEVQKFARDKKMEIESLKVREEYRREFLGNVSHELKTPLFTVQGYLLTLLDGAMDDKNIRKKYLQRAEKGVERLVYIVNDLDMITKLELDTLGIETSEFNIVDVIQNVLDLLEMRASKKNILLTFDMKYVRPIKVVADLEKIQQVVTNLVENSIKYGKENGTTEVSIEDFVNNKVIIKVIDNGEGIENHHIPRLFERFYRVDKSGARSEGGSGLGLAIVKHIIERHNEKINVESEFGKGSEFSFTLEKAK